MRMKSLLENEKFTLEVTMPQNLEFAQAVLDGGAQALKLRCNNTSVGPKSFGIFNGPFETRKDYLQGVIDLAGDVPCGLVPGVPDSFITPEQVREAEEMGFSYINCNPGFMPMYMAESKKMDLVLALTDQNMDGQMYEEINCDPRVDAVEINLVTINKEEDKRLSYEDILRTRSVVKKIHKPVIATAQCALKPEEVKYYYEAGCKSLMIGVVLFLIEQEKYGGKLTADTCKRVTAQFREAIEKL